MFRKLWNKMFGPFWDEMSLFEVKLFWSLQDKLFPSEMVVWIQPVCLWDVLKSGLQLPVSTRNRSEMETLDSCRSKEGQPLWERGAGPAGRPFPGPGGREKQPDLCFGWRGGMVVPACHRPAVTCYLLWASSMDRFAPGQVVFSVFLYFMIEWC